MIQPDGSKLGALHEPRLLELVAEWLGAETVRISDRAGAAIEVRPSPGGEVVPVNHSRQGTAVAVGQRADAWLSARLERAVRLVWQPDPSLRPISPAMGGMPGESLSLADAGPLLLVSHASLRQLNTWVAETEPWAEPLSQDRFRANVVIDGEADLVPFAEDDWSTVSIGDVEFRRTMVCDRCALTTIDPATLDRGKEPIRTLARHRRWDGQTWFGIRLAPLGTGTLNVGDPVVPRSTHQP